MWGKGSLRGVGNAPDMSVRAQAGGTLFTLVQRFGVSISQLPNTLMSQHKWEKRTSINRRDSGDERLLTYYSLAVLSERT